MSNVPCSLTRNITSHSMKNLAFHSLLRRKMILLPILTTSLIHFSLKGWENVPFELGNERVKRSAPSSFCRVTAPRLRTAVQRFRWRSAYLLSAFLARLPSWKSLLDQVSGTSVQSLSVNPHRHYFWSWAPSPGYMKAQSIQQARLRFLCWFCPSCKVVCRVACQTPGGLPSVRFGGCCCCDDGRRSPWSRPREGPGRRRWGTP